MEYNAFKNIPKCNLHTHTNLCDGNNTPEEIVLAAISEKMETLGFSGHSYVHFDLDCCMTREQTAQYRNEIVRLKKVYGDRLNILLGLEQEYYADDPAVGYDYLIGSVHYLPANGSWFAVDLSREELLRAANAYYGGNIYRLLQHYYETLADVVEKTGCDIIGHFDLISKFNADGMLFDETDPRYRVPAFETLEYLLKKDVVFEINTGAISRGYCSTPYPAAPFLRFIAEHGGRVTISSDAHDKTNLLYGFSEAMEYARAAGVKALCVMTKDGWKTVAN